MIDEENTLEDHLQENLGHCNCGCPEDSLLFIKKVLSNINESTIYMRAGDGSLNAEYAEQQNENLDSLFYKDDGIKYTILYMLDKYGFIEHRTNVRSSWITEKGEKFLEKLHEIKENDL